MCRGPVDEGKQGENKGIIFWLSSKLQPYTERSIPVLSGNFQPESRSSGRKRKFCVFFQDGIVVSSMRQSEVYYCMRVCVCVCVCVCVLTFWALYFVDMPSKYWFGARIKFWRFSNSCSIFCASKSHFVRKVHIRHWWPDAILNLVVFSEQDHMKPQRHGIYNFLLPWLTKFANIDSVGYASLCRKERFIISLFFSGIF